MVNKYNVQQDYAILRQHRPKEFITYGDYDFWVVNPFLYSSLKIDEFSSFIVDEKQDCYLRYGGRGYTEVMGITGHTYHLLYWQGQRIYFILKTIINNIIESEKKSYNELHIIRMMSLDKIAITTELCLAIEEALNTYYAKFWTNRIYINQFNFDLIK